MNREPRKHKRFLFHAHAVSMRAVLSLIATLILPAVLAAPAAGECFRLDGPKGKKREVPVDCDVAARSVLPPVREKIDVAALLKADSSRAAELLGRPYRSYKHSGHVVSMYGPRPNISIEYANDRPVTIMFDVTGVPSAEEIPAWLGLESFPQPVCFAPLDSVFWLNPPGMRMLEIHNPRYKIDGQYVYSVVIRLIYAGKGMEGILDGRMYGLRDGRIKPEPCR